MNYTWNLVSEATDEGMKEATLLSRKLNIPIVICQLLINRNIREASLAEGFLSQHLKDLPDPFLLKDMDKAVKRVVRAIEGGERILIYGDYDVDGTSGTALLVRFFREVGYPVEFYIPHRIREGYSLNGEALERFKREGFRIVITVDNGISALDEAGHARDLGLDLIITDHHQIAKELPVACAVVNPQRSDCPYPSKEICGTGVAFNLILALRQELRQRGYFATRACPNLKRYLDLVALATVADVVSLTGANRIFVKFGLQQMRKTEWEGIRALMNICHIEGEPTSTHLGFRLGPRINACGRLYDASIGVRLLLCDDAAEAKQLATELDSANQERQYLEKEILEAAIKMLERDPSAAKKMSHVLYHKDWHPGVIGIVASRIVERYHRPTVLLGNDGEDLRGSARGVGGLNLVEALGHCAPYLKKFGGHRMAAGVSLSAECLADFSEGFERAVSLQLSEEMCIPKINIDAELSVSDIKKSLYEAIKALEPFGQGNPEPLFCLRKICPKNGRLIGERHLKFWIENEGHLGRTEAIAFDMGVHLPRLMAPMDVAFSFRQNFFQGRESLVLHIKDIKFPAQTNEGSLS